MSPECARALTLSNHVAKSMYGHPASPERARLYICGAEGRMPLLTAAPEPIAQRAKRFIAELNNGSDRVDSYLSLLLEFICQEHVDYDLAPRQTIRQRLPSFRRAAAA